MNPEAVNHTPPRGGERKRASDHCTTMLSWWSEVGVDRADLALRRADGTMIWHRDLELQDLPLAWARAENVRRAEVYIRPARGYAWPVAFVDDVSPAIARQVSFRISTLVVRTSPIGGCHLWIRCARRLTEARRLAAQRWLARRLDGDPASVSGEHLGRLAGFKNWKRDGCWVNVNDASRHRCWDPPSPDHTREPTSKTHGPRSPTHQDTSPSGKEWGWVCGMLEAGLAPDLVARRLRATAGARQRRDPDRYTNLTMQSALRHVASHRTAPSQGS